MSDRKESSDTYDDVVHAEGGQRVILCKHGIQWIIQCRRPHKTSPWVSLHFCVTRKALLGLWSAQSRAPAPEVLTSLPEYAHNCALERGQSGVSHSDAPAHLTGPDGALAPISEGTHV